MPLRGTMRMRRACILALAATALAQTAPSRLPTALAAQPDSGHVKVDALVAGSWNGVTLVVDDKTGFQVRVGTWAEGADLLDGDHVGGFLTGIEDLLAVKPGQEHRTHPPS